MGTIDSLRLFCPEATLTITILVVLMLDLLMRNRPARHTALFTAALIGLAGAAWACVHLAGSDAQAIFSGMVAVDSLAVFFKIFSLVVGALAVGALGGGGGVDERLPVGAGERVAEHNVLAARGVGALPVGALPGARSPALARVLHQIVRGEPCRRYICKRGAKEAQGLWC